MKKQFLIYADALEMWMYQNKAIYTGDFFEGCLLDNFSVWCKNGYAAIYEHYLNPNSSCYEIIFSRDDPTVLDDFIENMDKANADYF